MKYTEAKQGRIFILRLEQGDRIPGVLEDFAASQDIKSALVFYLGGADKNSKVVVGPEEGTAEKPVPMLTGLPGVSEALGVGTIFVNEKGEPKMHLHSAFGRNQQTITGCTREGVDVWRIGEVLVMELTNCSAQRKVDPETGFELLEL